MLLVYSEVIYDEMVVRFEYLSYLFGKHTAHHGGQLFKLRASFLNNVKEYLLVPDLADNDLVQTFLETAECLVSELVKGHADVGSMRAHVIVKFGFSPDISIKPPIMKRKKNVL